MIVECRGTVAPLNKENIIVLNRAKVTSVSDGLVFDDHIMLYSDHEQDCCEVHYLSFSDLTLEDFEGLEFDLTSDSFFERIEDYGIALIPIVGHPIRIPGYGSNNGYYGSNIDLVIEVNHKVFKRFDVSECQSIEY